MCKEGAGVVDRSIVCINIEMDFHLINSLKIEKERI